MSDRPAASPRVVTRLVLVMLLAAAAAALSAPCRAVTALSSGYVTPASGGSGDQFTYRVKYWSTENIAPDQVWVGIWWGSRGCSYWYAMWPLEPSDTNYADGAWYTFKMRGLDSSSHAFRFVAQKGAETVNWPTPAGSYVLGPTVSNVTSLTSGYVTPDRGLESWEYTYRIKYWDSGNRPPDLRGDGAPHMYVAVFCESSGTARWYPMWKLDPSDANYRDGCWYTMRIGGLDLGDHFFRFAVRTAGEWTYWPEPTGAYQWGPWVMLPEVYGVFELYDRFEECMEAEDLTGLMTLFRSDYLHDGLTKQDKETEFADFFAGHTGIEVTFGSSQTGWAGDIARRSGDITIETDQGTVLEGWQTWTDDSWGILTSKGSGTSWLFFGNQQSP